MNLQPLRNLGLPQARHTATAPKTTFCMKNSRLYIPHGQANRGVARIQVTVRLMLWIQWEMKRLTTISLLLLGFLLEQLFLPAEHASLVRLGLRFGNHSFFLIKNRETCMGKDVVRI